MSFACCRISTQQGFTLIEVVMVIVITGILAGMGAMFLVKPMQGYVDLTTRTSLVESAESALRRMQRDVRQALPNSVRIAGAGTRLEILHSTDGGRYRHNGAGDKLDFSKADDGFDVLGSLRAAPKAGERTIIYNLAAGGTTGNAYAGDNSAIIGSGSTISYVVLDPTFRFPRPSPQQRFFVVDGPVSFVFDAGAGTLTRYSGYSIALSQPSGFPPGSGSLLADHVSGCQFTYAAGTSERAGLVTMRLTLSRGGETVTLLHQVHVVNVP